MMYDFALLSLLWLFKMAAAQVVYNQGDDPRCHGQPNRPILEPQSSSSPFPPINMKVWENPTPPHLLCDGLIKGFVLVDLDDPLATPMEIHHGMTIHLVDMPETFTVQAMVDGHVSKVKFYVDDTLVATDDSAPFDFTNGSEFSQLYVEGTYKLGATVDNESDSCAMTITIDYGNPPGVCPGLVTKFALLDTTTQALVPGYESLADGQDLYLMDLPDNLSIVAFTNPRGGNQVVFTVDDSDFATVKGDDATPFYPITNVVEGIVDESTLLREFGSLTIAAKMVNRLGKLEERACAITLHVTSDWICDHEIQGFSLIDTETDSVVPGYQHMAGNRVIDLANLNAKFLTLRANKVHDDVQGVQFFVNGKKVRTDTVTPFALNGDFQGQYSPSQYLKGAASHIFSARGLIPGSNKYETAALECALNLTITDTSYEKGGGVPPGTILKLIENDDGPCAPKLITPLTAGNHMYYDTPVKVVNVKTDQVVSFKIFNYIWSQPMDWITTSFVTASGVEVCDKVENVAFEDDTGHVYEAKCYNGFAFADVFAYSSLFSPDQAGADTTLLPDACKNSFDGQVVRYTFVFSCNCDKIPEIPAKIIGGVPESQISCQGKTTSSFGDPHVQTFDSSTKFDCMGSGEFVLSKAILDGYAYNFEVRSRFWKFELNDFEGTWNTGIAIQQDVLVQLSIAESQLPYSNMFAELPVNFYIDGEPRLLTQGSGDHRVVVTVDGFNVEIFFVNTGISIRVLVRPASVREHFAKVPGSLNVFICYPNNNKSIIHVTGLMGSPDGDASNDWVDSNGNVIEPFSMDSTEYCTTNWCIRDEADTFFTFDDGYDFSHYNRCDEPISRRHLSTDVSDVPEDVQAVCAQVDLDPTCLFDGMVAGLGAAELAVEAIKRQEQAEVGDKFAENQDDVACCSRDFKTCDDSCGTNKYLCGSCEADDTFIWLEHGELEGDCLVKASRCSSTVECCDGLECDSGVCVPAASQTRRLEEFALARPDLPFDRNIVSYADLF